MNKERRKAHSAGDSAAAAVVFEVPGGCLLDSVNGCPASTDFNLLTLGDC